MKDALTEEARRRQFERDFDEYYRQTFGYALNLTRERTEAEEITEAAILRFLELMEQRRWEPEIKNVRAYLRKIAKNIHADLQRNAREELLVDDDDEQVRQVLERKAVESNDPTGRLENDIDYRERYESLPLTILRGLSEDEERLLYMNVIDEMSLEEIAEAVGEDVARVGFRLNKLLAKIRYRSRAYAETRYGVPTSGEGGRAAAGRSRAYEKTSYDSPPDSLESAMRECVDAVSGAHEQIRRNREEVDRLGEETRRLLSELKVA